MSGPSGREEQGRKSEQPVPAEPSRFSLKRLFNWLAGCLPLTPLFNAFARPPGPTSGPRPQPIKIDPAWFPVPEPTGQPQAPPEPEYDDDFDPYAFAHDNPGWDEEPPEDEPDYISVHPGDKVPWDAGELLRTYYAPGIGDVCIYARMDPMDEEEPPEPDEISIYPGQKVPLEAGELLRSFYAPGIGDVHVYARRDIPDEEIHPDQIIEIDEWGDELAPESTPKPPK